MTRVADFQTSSQPGDLRNTAPERFKPVTPAPNFDRLAKIYRWMEWITFGPWLWRCRCAFLPAMQSRRRALVLGDGDGRFTARLLSQNKMIRVDAVDASPAMLDQLRRRTSSHADRVSTCAADVRGLTPDDSYDLIVAHFLLDCLSTREIKSLADLLRPRVRPGGIWVISEFAVPGNRFGRLVARRLVSFLYRAFAWLTGLAVSRLPDHHAALTMAGFRLQQRRRWLGGVLISEEWGLAVPHAARA